MIIEEEDDGYYLAHYGTPRHSGRYPWGSGGHETTQHARNQSFLDHVEECKKRGLSEKDIADGFGVSIAKVRDVKTIALNEIALNEIHQAEKLREKGLSNKKIAEQMGKPGESSIRALLEPGLKERKEKLANTTNMLKEQVEKHGVIDVGRGVESYLDISPEKLRASVSYLEMQGYNFHKVKNPQSANDNKTEMKVLSLPNISQKDIFLDKTLIKQIDAVSNDDGRTWTPAIKHPLVSINPKRVAIKYGDEGGAEADGVVFVREGVPDVNIGKSRYAQVRIKVGNDHYIKGMAMYSNDLPAGTDILFHTNKTREDALKKGDIKLGALKPLEKDSPDYPFGSIVRPQILHKGEVGKEKVVSALNIVNEEGDWKRWNRNISAQTLSKQAPSLAKDQLDRTYKAKKTDLENINALTNSVVKKKLLQTYSDAVDKSAVHLKAAGLDRQNWHVILPVKDIKPNEIYAPNYNNGESVVLIRYPHGGTFEIPELRVNNKHPGAIKLLGKEPLDGVGIHHSVAERLSGADFDGDTVLVIPNNSKTIKTDPALERLKGFEPKRQYRLPDGVTFKDKFGDVTQLEMGKISNLITDMTLMKAPNHEVVRAIMHSMVVIDADKHDLDIKRSSQDFAIGELKKRYQGSANGGASTLISRAKSRLSPDPPERKARPAKDGGPINKVTGELEFVPTNRVGRNGKLITFRTTKLAETKNAHDLVSIAETRVEKLYADHSNRLKSLANQARLSMINQPKLKSVPTAKKAYAAEVATLNSKLVIAKKNAPRERQAQIIANQIVASEKAANPTLDTNSIKKIKFRAQTEARARMGVHSEPIKITSSEWAAIQAGAVSEHTLKQILDKADMDIVLKHATPRSRRILSTSDAELAKRLLGGGASRADVAKRLGVSISTLDAATIGDGEVTR